MVAAVSGFRAVMRLAFTAIFIPGRTQLNPPRGSRTESRAARQHSSVYSAQGRMTTLPMPYRASTYRQAATAATAPSPAAVVSCLSSLARQSPAAKRPGEAVRQRSSLSIYP